MSEPRVRVNGLQMGSGTPYEVVRFNPFVRQVRADAEQPRAWAHGALSGAEWQEPPIVPLTVSMRADDACPHEERLAQWLGFQRKLSAAFAAHGDAEVEGELVYEMGGAEYAMFGRPRMQEPDTEALWWSASALVECAFVALDPFTYSADERQVVMGLPTFEGGLTFPATFPLAFDATLVGGQATDVVNEGTAPAGLRLLIEGPVDQPRVAVIHDGEAVIVRFDVTLGSGQWLEVDTDLRTVLINGVTSRRDIVVGEFPLLPPEGTSTIRFGAAHENATAQLTATWRAVWW